MLVIDTYGAFERLISVFDKEQAERLVQVMRDLAEQVVRTQERFDALVTKEEFAELKQAVEELTQAQARTEEAVQKLAQAQTRTEERLNRLEAAVEKLAQAQARTEKRVEELAQAQARTEERLNRLEAAVEKLAQAQARTEERLNRLEATVEKLAEAQARTEEAVQELTRAVKTLRQQVGALSDNIGLGLEDLGYALLPAYIEHTYGFQDVTLQRAFIGPPGQEIEVNLYGEGRRDSEEIVLIGEAKNRIKYAEVKDFAKKLPQLREVIDKPIFPFMFAFWIHPSAQRLAEEQGIELIVSYRLIR